MSVLDAGNINYSVWKILDVDTLKKVDNIYVNLCLWRYILYNLR